MADTLFNRRIFHAFPMKPWTVLVQTILLTFLSSQKRLNIANFSPSSVPRRKVLLCFLCVVSCCGAGLRPCRAATQSFCLFSLRRGIIWDSFAVKWNTTQSFVLISLRRVRYVCLVVFFFWGGDEWRYGLYDPEDTGLVFFEAFRAGEGSGCCAGRV